MYNIVFFVEIKIKNKLEINSLNFFEKRVPCVKDEKYVCKHNFLLFEITVIFKEIPLSLGTLRFPKYGPFDRNMVTPNIVWI